MSGSIIVPPQIPAKLPCPIMFIGEAPGEEEVSRRVDGLPAPRPFVGPAGRLFDSILRSANLNRDDYWITNLFDEKAPNNDVGPWLADEARMAEAGARLFAEWKRSGANVVVPLGNSALWALTGQTKISSFRGAVLAASHILPGAKLLPTYHPMGVQHKWQVLPLVVDDLIKAADEARRGPKLSYPNVTLLVEPTLDEALRFMKDCAGADLLATDIETGWGGITSIGFAPTDSLAMNIPFVDLRKPSKSYWGSAAAEYKVWMGIKELLEGPVPKLGQNYTYDAMWLLKKQGIKTMNYLHDTRLLHHAMFPELPKDLATMAANYTRVGAWKAWSDWNATKEKRDN